MNSAMHKKIYGTVLDVLKNGKLQHNELIEKSVKRLYGQNADGHVGEFTEIRGLIGAVISEMKGDGVILYDKGVYSRGADGAMPMRMERCEKEICSSISYPLSLFSVYYITPQNFCQGKAVQR